MLSYTQYQAGFPILNEVHEKYIDMVIDRLKMKPEKMPLNNMFKGKTRIVFPLLTDEFAQFNDILTSQGFTPDFANGTATRTTTTQRGAKQVTLRIGKALEMLSKTSSEGPGGVKLPPKIDAKWAAYWNKNGDNLMRQYKQLPEPLSVIISRNAVDLLRMSDFDKISSCHSQGREYFSCAISEAQNGGAIAFLVKSKDLSEGINLEEPEIFKDSSRGVKGITPIARVRIRLFEDEKGTQLGIPETRVYGQKIPGFLEQVRSWARGALKDTLQGQRPRMNQFQLRGGYYHDSTASKLFNNFFGDKLDYGDVGHQAGKGEEDALEAHNEERRREIQQIHNNEAKFEHEDHVGCGFNEGDEPREDGEIEFWFDGWIMFEFPIRQFDMKKFDKQGYRGYDIARAYSRKDRYSRFEDGNLERIGNMVEIRFSINDRESGNYGGPDEYSSFIDSVKEYDGKYNEIQTTLRGVLIEMGLMVRGSHDRLIQLINAEKFEHFSFNEDPYDGTKADELSLGSENIYLCRRFELAQNVQMKGYTNWQRPGWGETPQEPTQSFTHEPVTKPSYGMPPPKPQTYFPGRKQEDKFNEVRNTVMQRVKQWWDKVKQSYNQQPFLPGMQKPPFRDSMKGMIEPQLHFSWDIGGQFIDQKLICQIDFPFSFGQSNYEILGILKSIKFIDQNWDRFVKEIEQAVYQVIHAEYQRVHSQPNTGTQQ